MFKRLTPFTLAALFSLPAAHGEIIGIDDFDHSDGPIATRTGGTSWDWSQNTATPSHTGSASDWNNVPDFMAATVNRARLETSNSGAAKREFNGPSEGTGTTDENDGAFAGSGVLYFRVDMARDNEVTYSGLSSDEFGTERIFFGVPIAPNPASGKREFGIQIDQPNTSYSNIEASPGRSHTLVGKLDFDSDLLSLWIDPDLSTTEIENTPAATAAYLGADWSTALRLSSGGTGTTAWDDLIVATTWDDIAINPRIPNPSFELDSFPNSPGHIAGNTQIAGWSTTGSSSVGINPISDGTSPIANTGDIPDGSQVAFIQSSGNTENSISTTITGLQTGTHYRVSFQASASNLDAVSASPSWSLNGSSFQTFDSVSGSYRAVERIFLADAPTAELIIQNQTNTASTFLVDDLRISIDHSVFTTTESDGELTITGYSLDGVSCPVGALIIPESIGTKPVTSIGEWVFHGCSGLTKITLPDGFTGIGDGAFSSCSNLTEITLPEGLNRIGNGAFRRCSSLTAITVEATNPFFHSRDGIIFDKNMETILVYPPGKTGTFVVPSQVTSIGDFAFYNCTGLTAVTFPEGLTSIGNDAFHNCPGLTAVTFPEGLTSIGKGAFFFCSGLTMINFPVELTSIGESAFASCDGLTTVILPEEITSIRHGTFQYCGSLTTITFPNGLASIGNSAFAGCDDLTSINFPVGLTSIGDSAFEYCDALTLINFPSGLTSIGDSAFEYCEGLTSINFPTGLTSIGNETFRDCTSLTTVTFADGPFSIGDSAFEKCSNLTAIIFEEGLTTIGNFAFDDCSSLTAVTFPAGLTTIGGYAFEQCDGLIEINFPTGLTSIGDYAFFSCDSLTEVTLREGLTHLNRGAFSSCINLAKVTLPEGLTSIGDRAFHSCSGLTTIVFPEGLTSIGDEAFYSCSSLTTITFSEELTDRAYDKFTHCRKLTAVYFLGDAPQISSIYSFPSSSPVIYYLEGKNGWRETFNSYVTELWGPTTHIKNIELSQANIDLSWSSSGPGARYRIESSPDGRIWSGVPNFENISDTSAFLPRPDNMPRLFFRILPATN